MPISTQKFRRYGQTFVPIIPLPPAPPSTILPRPIPNLENEILAYLDRYPSYAFTLGEIISGIEGSVSSPISGLFYSLAIAHLIHSNRIETRTIHNNTYYALP